MRKLAALALVTATALTAGCATPVTRTTPFGTTGSVSETPTVTDLRAKAIRNAVTEWAVQASVYHWMRAEHRTLLERRVQLDQMFDFRALLIDGRITPPIIVQAHDTFRLLRPDLATSTITEYRIASVAKIVTRAPSWRDYLLAPIPKPRPLATILRPKSIAERTIWRDAEHKGWRLGIRQAKALLNADFARLRRAYTGMVLAKILIRQKVLSAPILARSDQGVRIQGNTLAVGAVILRITHHSDYNRSTEWKAIPSIQTSH